MLRDIIDVADDKSLSQGTIFNCAYCALYPNDETLGLIVTARCDIANKDKVKFFNYIPAIPFNIWKKKELLPLLKKRVYKNLFHQYLTLISSAGFSETNVKTYGFEKILEEIKKQKKINARDLTKLLTLKEKLSCFIDEGNYEVMHRLFSDEIKKCIDDIIENKNPDYFLIDRVPGYNAVVVNLREIYELSISTAKLIPNGIDLEYNGNHPGLNINIENKFCSIVGQMKSPYIELLIQRFANNFIRIGVTNPHKELSTSIMGI